MSISINDVARVAGVSKSTVSRVLGGGPVSEAVRGRVEAPTCRHDACGPGTPASSG